MKGAYLITRFLSFYLLFNELLMKEGEKYEYMGDIDDLIEVALMQLNELSQKELEDLKLFTIKCLKLSYDILGAGA